MDKFGRLGDTNFFAAGDIAQVGSGQPLMVVNAVGDGKRVAFNLDKVMRGEALQPRTIPGRRHLRSESHEHDVLPALPARPAGNAADEDQNQNAGRSDSSVHRRAGRGRSEPLLQLRHLQRLRQLLSGLSRAVHCAPGALERHCTRFWSTTVKDAACASKNVRQAAWKACLNSTSILASCAWIRLSPFRLDCTDARRRVEESW